MERTGLRDKEAYLRFSTALINRSYIYYDDAIDVLGMMKRMSSGAEWRAYISAFVEANKGKRKLMEKMRGC